MKANLRTLWMSRLRQQHARLLLTVTNIEHEKDDSLIAYSAIPTRALTRENPAFLELERRLDRAIPETSSQLMTDKIHGIVWAWWKGNPKGGYQHIAKPELVLRRICRSLAPDVLVPIVEFHLILEHIKHSATPQTMVRKGKCYLMPRKLLLEILHRYDMWEIQQSMFFNQPASTQAIHGVPRRPMLWKRLKILSPKNISSLGCIKNSKGVLVTSPRDIDQATRDTRTFWEETPQPLPDTLIATLREYQAKSPSFPPIPPPSHDHHMSSINRTETPLPGSMGYLSRCLESYQRNLHNSWNGGWRTYSLRNLLYGRHNNY